MKTSNTLMKEMEDLTEYMDYRGFEVKELNKEAVVQARTEGLIVGGLITVIVALAFSKVGI